MQEAGKEWGRGTVWSQEELDFIRDNIHVDKNILAKSLPGRTPQAINNIKWRIRHEEANVPPVKAPGDYLETLSAYFADHFECLHIWLKWNGYATCRELSRDMEAAPLGIVTLICTAKLWRTAQRKSPTSSAIRCSAWRCSYPGERILPKARYCNWRLIPAGI